MARVPGPVIIIFVLTVITIIIMFIIIIIITIIILQSDGEITCRNRSTARSDSHFSLLHPVYKDKIR